MRWLVVARTTNGVAVERYFLRRWGTVCQVRNYLMRDYTIACIELIVLCKECGCELHAGACQPLLEAVHAQ